jgi:hypothetical protein
MGLRQTFRFRKGTSEDIRVFLRSFSHTVDVEDRHDFFVFNSRGEVKPFSMDFELVPAGLKSDRAGEYFWFLGFFVESLTGQFGAVEIEDV